MQCADIKSPSSHRGLFLYSNPGRVWQTRSLTCINGRHLAIKIDMTQESFYETFIFLFHPNIGSLILISHFHSFLGNLNSFFKKSILNHDCLKHEVILKFSSLQSGGGGEDRHFLTQHFQICMSIYIFINYLK